MKPSGMMKKLAGIAVFAIGLCFVGCNKPTPEQIAERTELLFKAIKNNNLEQAKACIKAGADVNIRNDDGLTALMCAVSENSKEMVELLLKAKADVNATGRFGYPALRVWAWRAIDRIDLLTILINAGADVNAEDGSIFKDVIRHGTPDVAELFIKAGADVNTDDVNTSDRHTVLMYAAEREDMKGIVKLLIDAGADVNAVDDNGFTALWSSVLSENKDIMKLLITSGADVNAKTNYGDTVLKFATDRGEDDMVEMLRAAGAKE